MYENENNNNENNNFDNGNEINSNAENNNTQNNNENNTPETTANDSYRMTQSEIINHGITQIEQGNDTNNNNFNTNTNTNANSVNNSGYNYGNNAPYGNNARYGNNANYGGNAGYGNYNSGYNNNNNSGYNSYNGQNNNINNNQNMNPNAMNSTSNNLNQRKMKKKSGVGKKVAFVALSAVLFGVIAGGTTYGVYYAANQINPINGNSNIQLPTVSTGNVIEESDDYDNTMISTSEELNVKKVAKSAMPAMVALTGTTQVSSSSIWGGFGQTYQAATSGTGIIVGKNDTELLVLTNAHVVQDVNDLTCTFVDNESVECTVKGSKTDKDVAVVAVPLSAIKSSTLNMVSIAELGDSDSVVLGQEVVAIGNALGKGQSVTSGIISALDRSITVDNVTFDGLIMTDAAINSGNSGGALLDASGKVVGINFAKTSADGVQGMAYSIPISNVRDLIDSLMNRETREKVKEGEVGYLGISMLDVTSQEAEAYDYPVGTMIRYIEKGSAADKFGLSIYDIIVSFDDQTVTTASSLMSMLQYYKAGETVKIEFYRMEDKEFVLKSVDVTLGQKNN